MPLPEDIRAVKSIDDAADYLLGDIEWLGHEIGNASPGHESDLMRLLLSRVTLNNMFQFCALLDAQGTMWDVNHAALRGAGITRADIHGKPFWEARWWQTSVETREQLKTVIGRAALGEFVRYDVDIVGRASGSEIITIDFDIAPVKDGDGNVRFLVCEGRDVTEQRRLEREVLRQREELAHELRRRIEILDRVSDAFYAVDPELRIVYVNRRLEELIQQPRQQLMGQRIGDVFPDVWDDDEESHRRRFAAMGDALSARFESFSEVLGAWIEGSIYRSDTGYSVYLQDISGRRHIEEELRLVAAQAEAAALARSRLLAAASQDLRPPLNEIIHEVLQPATPDAEHSPRLVRAQRAAGRLASALDKLTELGQLDSGQREPQRRTFLIRDLLEQIRNTWAPLAREKELGFELPESQELVHSDPEMLGTILQHLVGNAIGHTDGGRVWIECRRRDEVLVIEVHDTGIGIPEDKLDAIFEEFQQLHPSRSEGMGLGLSIVRRTAGLLRHRIAVRSAPGEGSCFQIEVPSGSWRHVTHT
jgi:PAS domain S-box-containing protein